LIEYKDKKAFIVSAYFDINTKMEDELNRLEKILELTKKHGILIAVDSNSRSAAWCDIITNKRGKILEEYMVSKDLYVMNESRQEPRFTIREVKAT
jgi:histidinol phosphatase-like PHP family hydrolase